MTYEHIFVFGKTISREPGIYFSGATHFDGKDNVVLLPFLPF